MTNHQSHQIWKLSEQRSQRSCSHSVKWTKSQTEKLHAMYICICPNTIFFVILCSRILHIWEVYKNLSLKCIHFLLKNPFIDLWSSNLYLCCKFYDIFLGWQFLWHHRHNIGNNQINYLSTMNCFWIYCLLLDSITLLYCFTHWFINIL